MEEKLDLSYFQIQQVPLQGPHVLSSRSPFKHRLISQIELHLFCHL